MRTLLAALTALMLFATPVMAGDFEDALVAAKAGDFQKAFRLWKPLAEQGDARAQRNLGLMYEYGDGVPEDDVKAVDFYISCSLLVSSTAMHADRPKRPHPRRGILA